MYCLIAFIFTISLTHAASSGAKKCDALGLCKIPASGAYTNENGDVICPWGMHLVTPPRRSDAYIVSTAAYGETGPTYYTPGQYMDIHVITIGPQYMKFLGILMYAVQVSDGLGPEGCPEGCDGMEEVKLGSWEVTNNMFQVSEPCDGQAVTHRNADPKPYNNVFRWKAPEAGSGDVMFRVVIKQGSTNMGHFWWPMTSGDLMLTEGPTESISEWFSGDVSSTCTEICAAEGRECDRSMPTGSLDLYSEHVGKTQGCQAPLLSTCSRTAPSRDDEGFCWFDNQDSGLCDQSQPVINICDAVEVAGGSSRLCPCKPTNDDDWLAQSTSAPSAKPSTSPLTSTPTLYPTTDAPTSAPSHWYDPRWEEFLNGATTCARSFRLSRTCKRGCSYSRCQDSCKENSRCKFFFFRPQTGFCMLYNGCSTQVGSGSGVTVQKIVIPTNEPSYGPTFSEPTGIPTISEPSGSPSVMPTNIPTSSDPSSAPSGMPSGTPSRIPTSSKPTNMPTASEPTKTPSSFPTSSLPTMLPTTWDTPRWFFEIQNESKTCSKRDRLGVLCKNGCWGDFCRNACAERASCGFYHTNTRGRCELFRTCEGRRNTRMGSTWRKHLCTSPTDCS